MSRHKTTMGGAALMKVKNGDGTRNKLADTYPTVNKKSRLHLFHISEGRKPRGF